MLSAFQAACPQECGVILLVEVVVSLSQLVVVYSLVIVAVSIN